MQFINIKDHKTGDTVKALNFGGPKCYKVSNRFVWAPNGGTSLTINENSIILEPLGLVVHNPNIWTIVSHQNIGTANWRVTVKNLATNEEKSGVYPFNLSGNVYELECQPGTWVMASCKGYKIESSWVGQTSNEAFRLKGTGEILYIITISIAGTGTSFGYLYMVDYTTKLLSDQDFAATVAIYGYRPLSSPYIYLRYLSHNAIYLENVPLRTTNISPWHESGAYAASEFWAFMQPYIDNEFKSMFPILPLSEKVKVSATSFTFRRTYRYSAVEIKNPMVIITTPAYLFDIVFSLDAIAIRDLHRLMHPLWADLWQ